MVPKTPEQVWAETEKYERQKKVQKEADKKSKIKNEEARRKQCEWQKNFLKKTIKKKENGKIEKTREVPSALKNVQALAKNISMYC